MADEKTPAFSIGIDTNDPVSYLAQQIFELRVEVGALTVLVMDVLAATGKDLEGISKRYMAARDDLRLRLAFELQDSDSGKSGE